MFYLKLQLTKLPGGDRVVYAVADVANTSRMRRIIGERAVEIIFHAAAYKHVPLVESNIRGALSNSVLAVPPLLDVAEECGCEAFVLISSDKAVQPTSFMAPPRGWANSSWRPGQKSACVAFQCGLVTYWVLKAV